MVNFSDAVKIYELMMPYFPTVMEEDVVVKYADKLLQNMKESPQKIITLLELMTGYTTEEIMNFTSGKLYEIFITEIVENKILQLQDFMEGFGYGNA